MMGRKKTIKALCIVFLLSVATSAIALDNVRLAYPSPNTDFWYLGIAQTEGYFKQEGLNVELINMRGDVAVRTALAGEIDFFATVGSALVAAIRGVPIKTLMVLQDEPAWELIAQGDVKSIAQLRGTTVAVMSPEGSISVVTREILRKNGLDPAKDLTLMTMGGEDVRMLALRGKVVSATLVEGGTVPGAKKEGFVSLARAADYIKYPQGGIAATEERIKRDPEKVNRFILASLKGLRFYMTKKEESITHMMNLFKLKDRDTASRIRDLEIKPLRREAFVDEKVLSQFIDFGKRATGVKKEIPIGDVYNFSFIQEANERLKASGWRP
jgi:NitT/TauT family transport system substrate-binding protein